MEDKIGDVAGTIWTHLKQHGEMSLSKLKQGTKLSDQLLFMGLGWLAREDKLNFVQDKKAMRISLRGA